MASLVSFSVPKPGIVRATSLSTTTSIPTTSDSGSTLEEKFGRKGIKFSESNNNVPLVELTVRNGSSLKLQIPDAHITSYLPKVYWKDDGFEEILYTIPPTGDGKKSKGGIGLVVYDHVSSSSKPTLVTDSEWSVKGVDSDAIDAVQVELECTTGKLEMTYVVTLYPVSIATAVIVKNNGVKPVTLTSAILSHLKFKYRAKSAIQGLRACTYCTHPPLSSPFEIITPDEAMKPDSPGLFDFFFEPEEKPGSWKVQDIPFTMLNHRLSRIYAAPPEERLKPFYNTPPSKFETLDQGKELFFRVIRMGDFEDIYLSSPGPFSEKYGDQKHHFICTGPAAMLVPVVVEPGEDWRGAQVIEHDNL
ncbi:Photosynthetic NDH subunit of subcomplex B 2, chloroplastic [Linum perenne]